MPPNDYKADGQKPSVHSAVLVPFRRALLALARMMQGQVERHKLGGAENPFTQWEQLPDVLERLSNAGGRHGLFARDAVNPDSGETHALHDLWNLLAVVELQERAKEAREVGSLYQTRPFARDAAAMVRSVASSTAVETGRAAAPLGARLCLCGHRQDSHDTRADGLALECVATIGTGSTKHYCPCPEFREE